VHRPGCIGLDQPRENFGVEVAIRTDAAVSSASVDEVPALAENQGIVALLRY
jgi:hypothetical protein